MINNNRLFVIFLFIAKSLFCNHWEIEILLDECAIWLFFNYYVRFVCFYYYVFSGKIAGYLRFRYVWKTQ